MKADKQAGAMVKVRGDKDMTDFLSKDNIALNVKDMTLMISCNRGSQAMDYSLQELNYTRLHN